MLDGAWGTLIHGAGLGPADYRGERFADHPVDVTRRPRHPQPDPAGLRRAIHEQLPRGRRRHHDDEHVHGDVDRPGRLRARAVVYEMNVAGARIAREVAGDRFVAGSVGPLNVTLSLSPKVDDPGFRTHTFDQVKEAYAEQMRALAEGGVDLLLLETVFDTLNAKAAIVAARESAPELPLWISATIVDLSGRTLSGQTIEAFWASVEHAEPLIVGDQLLARRARDAAVRRRARARRAVPRQRAPERGPAERVRRLRRDARGDEQRCCASSPRPGFLNVAGSCCGSTPEHTAAIARRCAGLAPRVPVPAGAARDALERPRAVRDRPGHRLRPDRRADERDRLGALPAPRRGRRLHRRGRGRARAGARRRERPRREHGRRPARERRGDAHVPERDRDRARGRAAAGDGRQLALDA